MNAKPRRRSTRCALPKGLAAPEGVTTWLALEVALLTSFLGHAPDTGIEPILAHCPGNDPAVSQAVDPARLAAMSEEEWMNYVVEQLHSGKLQPYARLTEADLKAMEEEPIGEHFSRYPFLY